MTKFKSTISDVRKACSDVCTYVYTEKLFFKTYSLRLGFDNIQLWTLFGFRHGGGYSITNNEDRREDMNKLRNVHKKITQFLDSNKIDYRLRRESKFHVYLNDTDIAIKLIKRFRLFLIDVHGPANEVQRDTMKNNCKILVRDNLFYKKYRYKIIWPGSTEIVDGGAEHIYDILKTLDEDSYRLSDNFRIAANITGTTSRTRYASYISRQLTSGWRRLYDWHRVTIYLKDETDYLQIKLMTPYKTLEELEVVTQDEIDSDK